mgnify:CR=1 FL=1
MLAETVVTFGAGIAFGLALAAPPGPMNAIIAQESVVRGRLAGFRAGLGAMAADFVFFLLALAGTVTVVESRPTLRAAMVTVGGVLMLYFAVGAVRSADQTLTGGELEATARSFSKTFVLALTNPYQILFWLTVGIGLLEPGRIDVLGYTPYVGDALTGVLIVETGSPVLLAGLFAGIVLWITAFPTVLVAGRERVDTLAPAVAVLSAIVLAAFGVLFLSDGLRSLL